jgi:hypothetical protein
MHPLYNKAHAWPGQSPVILSKAKNPVRFCWQYPSGFFALLRMTGRLLSVTNPCSSVLSVVKTPLFATLCDLGVKK